MQLGRVRVSSHSAVMSPLLEALATELERRRELPAQVATHVTGTYAVERDAVGPFLIHEMGKLEDYEIDLILSPAFTPTLQDQAVRRIIGQGISGVGAMAGVSAATGGPAHVCAVSHGGRTGACGAIARGDD